MVKDNNSCYYYVTRTFECFMLDYKHKKTPQFPEGFLKLIS